MGDVFCANPYPPALPSNGARYTLIFIASHNAREREELGGILFRDYNPETRAEMIAKFVSMTCVDPSQTRLKWKSNHKGLVFEK